jgi:protein-S-isoprenylcysteine O-methyltransferase Ste14
LRANSIVFRLRLYIQAIFVVFGYWAPWLYLPSLRGLDFASRISTLEWLALEISRTGLVHFTYATPIVIVAGALAAALGVVFRVWGAAYLGHTTVHHARMQAGGVMTAGPYRYVRNPLYLGAWFMVLALSLLMPPTGALFAMVLETVFLIWIIRSEEAFLSVQLGEPYRDYLRAVPRLIPRLRSSLPRVVVQPDWPTALISEVNPLGIFFTLAVLSWRYDNLLMIKSIVIFFGLSLVIRGVMQRGDAAPNAA